MNNATPNDQHLPLVTVGIPTYNRPESLARTLDRVARQTYRHLEIIVSDNASDGTATQDVVNAFCKSDHRIQYHRQSSNLGANANFDFVLKKASGNYFMWAADDDYFDDENLIEALYSAIGGVKKMAFPNVNLICNDKTHNQYRCLTDFYSAAQTDEDYLLAWCRHGSGYPIYGLFNMEKATKPELKASIDSRLKCFGEGMFLHKLFLSGQIAYVDSVSLNYSASATATTMPHGQLLMDFITYTRGVLCLYLEAPLEEAFRKRLMRTLIDVHWPYLSSLARQATEKRPSA